MSYIEFETKDAEYRLILEVHGTQRKEPLDDLDALVLETGLGPQAGGLFVRFQELKSGLGCVGGLGERTVLYSVDTPPKYSHSLLSLVPFAAHTAGVAGMAMASLHAMDVPIDYSTALAAVVVSEFPSPVLGFLNGKKVSTRNAFVQAMSLRSMIVQEPVTTYRDAFASRKISTGVLNRIRELRREELGNRKPRIGVWYGAAHVGIQHQLRFPAVQQATLRIHHWYGRLFRDRKNRDTMAELLPPSFDTTSRDTDFDILSSIRTLPCPVFPKKR